MLSVRLSKGILLCWCVCACAVRASIVGLFRCRSDAVVSVWVACVLALHATAVPVWFPSQPSVRQPGMLAVQGWKGLLVPERSVFGAVAGTVAALWGVRVGWGLGVGLASLLYLLFLAW